MSGARSVGEVMSGARSGARSVGEQGKTCSERARKAGVRLSRGDTIRWCQMVSDRVE